MDKRTTPKLFEREGCCRQSPTLIRTPRLTRPQAITQELRKVQKETKEQPKVH